jgi:hypothetical protein
MQFANAICNAWDIVLDDADREKRLKWLRRTVATIPEPAERLTMEDASV